MRQFLLTLLMLLCLPLPALAEDCDLYPARGDNGLYGYIDAEAEWVIAPQFDGVGAFRGDYAIAILYPEGFVDDPDDPFDEEEVASTGIVDRTGRFVLEPVAGYIDAGYDGRYYGGKDTGISGSGWSVPTRATASSIFPAGITPGRVQIRGIGCPTAS